MSTERTCTSTSKGRRCAGTFEHEEVGTMHRDASGSTWSAHVPAPGGVCIPDPEA